MFLVCNYADPTYSQIKSLDISRNTFHTISGEAPSDNHAAKEYRLKVKENLDKGGLISYNNGDPVMFNAVSRILSYNISVAASRGILKVVNDVKETLPLVRRPIEIISEFQKDFFLNNKRLVGGQTHDLSIDNAGQYYSSTGVK